MDAAVDDFEAQRGMRPFRAWIVDQRVRCHLTASMGACPFLGRAHQFPADSLAAMLFANEPPLDEPHGPPRIATIGMRTQANFEKAGQRPALVFANHGHNRKLRLPEAGLALFQFREVFLLRSIRPEQGSHHRDLGPVLGFGLPDPGQQRLLQPRGGEQGQTRRGKSESIGTFAEVEFVEPF